MLRWVLLPLLGIPSVAVAAETPSPAPPRELVDLFEARVRPVLARRCFGCHGADKQRSDLRVDSRAALLQGGKRGPAIVPGSPAASLVVKAIRHQDGLEMPKEGEKLAAREIEAIEKWIAGGAVWPVEAAAAGSSREERYRRLASEHWAFRPVEKPPVPSGSVGGAAPANPIDAFLAAGLAKAGIAPAGRAAPRTLARRASWVLTGLLPTADELDRFTADRSGDGYERLVDRLLASPRFGERWARHWLDLARYGETRGYEWNYEIIGAWRYRDYLVRAFNADLPYDQLVREHLAGDLLPRPRLNRADGVNESIIGTTFFRLGEAGHDDCVQFREIALDVVDNQIDTLSKTFQGLTVACSRCHNHKLDPIAIDDYYGLYGVLNSSRQVTHTIDLPQVHAPAIAALERGKRRIGAALAALWRREAREAAGILKALAAEGATTAARGAPDPARLEAWRRALEAKEAKEAKDPKDPKDPKLEDVAAPWAALGREPAERFAAAARELEVRYRKEEAERAAFNRARFEPFGDMRRGGDGGWFSSGAGLAAGAAASAEVVVAPEGDAAVAAVLPAGLYTHRLSSRLGGALRSPDLPKTRKFLSLRLVGGMAAARRTLIDNCSIGDNYELLDVERPRWVRVATQAAQKRVPVYVELVTRWQNPRLPERPGSVKPPHDKWLSVPRSFFGISQAVLHDGDETPREELGHMARLWQGGPPESRAALAARYAAAVVGAVDRFAAGKADDDDARWLDFLVRNRLLTNDARAPRLRALLGEYRRAEAGIREPRVIEGMADMGPGRDFPVLAGGDPKSDGPGTPRRFLRYLFGDEPFAGPGSGRRQLAEVIASPRNPLTARTMVNRLWHHVFGRGLVGSVDNLGHIGDKPSNPPLLDYLASRFVEEGWSTKRLLRLLVTSEAFRRSGEIPARAREVDPENALLHHYPLRRLDAESLRDHLLAVGGKLSPRMYGESVQPHREKPASYRRLFAGPLDGDGRRSLYLKVTRMEGPLFLETFDYPNPMATRGARDVTNVPTQALAMLNDPFVVATAEAVAARLVGRPAEAVEARVEAVFRTALGRSPVAAERERFAALARGLGRLHGLDEGALLESRVVWKDVVHATLNLKELLYVQ